MIIIYIRKRSISGTVVVGEKTKELVKRLKKNQIAILQHFQIDCVAAKDLVRQKPLAVINFSTSVSDYMPVSGAKILLNNGILLFDVVSNPSLFSQIKDGMNITISLRNGILHCPDINQSASIQAITLDYANKAIHSAFQNFNMLFDQFLSNTLEFAFKERDTFLQPFPKVNLKTNIKSREVVIVTRGPDAVEDFCAIASYIRRKLPILIGVDGGADIILDAGLVPHIVIGDMDSISDYAMTIVDDLVIHTYPSGQCPGLRRVSTLGLDYTLLPFVGTSEDVAILLAYEYGASRIILVGSHSHMLDFLEKGRKGMASTFLTRMKAGHLITDVKGIHTLFEQSRLGEMDLDDIDYHSGIQRGRFFTEDTSYSRSTSFLG